MDPIYTATFCVAFLSSIISGFAGGGGGFIMAPFWLLSGMTPAEGASTGAFMAIGMGSSSLAAYKGSGHMPKDRRIVVALLSITLLTSLIGPFFLQQVHIDVFKPLLAGLTVLSLPFLFIDRRRLAFPQATPSVGYGVMALLLLVSSFVTSSAFSIMMAVVLVRSFGMTTLQSTAARRLIGIVQSVVIFIVLVSLGNFLPVHALMALCGGSLGSYIGTRISVNRGERFAKYALAAGALIGSIALLR